MAEDVAHLVPGAHFAVVWEHGIALLDRSLPAQDVLALWETLHGVADLTRFFGCLASGTGLGLLELPPFGVAIHVEPGAAQLAARGGFVVDVAASAGLPEPLRVSGESVATWVEKRVDASGGLAIRALDGDLEGSADPGLAWPLVAGVGPASSVSRGPVPVASPDAVVRPTVVPESRPVDVISSDEPSPEELDHPGTGQGEDSEPAAAVAQQKPEPQPEPEPEPFLVTEAVEGQGPFSHLWSDHTIITPPEEAAVRPAPADGPLPDEPQVVEPADSAGGRTAEETWVESSRSRDADAGAGADGPRSESIDRGGPSSTPGTPKFISWVPSAGGGPAAAPDAKLGDHDGHTVMSIPEPEVNSPKFVVASRQGAEEPDLIVGVLCPSGHGNPPQRSSCRVCHADIAESPVRMPRPGLGRLSSSTGESFELTVPVVVGRNPRASRFQGTEIPRLVAIPQAHVSASHLEIRLEGWSVVAVDLKSTNGTFLRRHSDPPLRLPETPQLLVSDDVLDLGHGVHLTFTGLP